jgi:hypothetical protein
MSKRAAEPKQIGTFDFIDGDIAREVPRYRPAVGQSINDAAKALGLRALGRTEPRAGVVAVISDGGFNAYCVKAVKP